MKDQFKKYLWILDLLYSSGGITFKEMAEKWKESSLNDRKTILAKRTFDDYRRAIEETFDVDIICDASRGYQYRIDNARSLSTDRIKRWLLSSFAVNNVLQGSRRLSERIIYEDIPSGNDYLLEVVKAMQDGKVISVEYDNFFESTPKQLLIEPYCVKVFRQRWYVVGVMENEPKGEEPTMLTNQGSIRRYALDRVVKLESTDVTFKMPRDFSVSDYFADAFGIIVEPEEYDIETIRIKVYDINHRREYLRSLPLHESQKEVERHKDYSVFELRIAPTYDCIKEILSMGGEVEVISPEYVRQEVEHRAEELLARYKNA